MTETQQSAPVANPDAIPKYSAKWWLEQIKTSEKEYEQFHKDGVAAYRKFLDQHEDAVASSQQPYRYNLFWANTQIIRTSLYSQMPLPEVKRRWEDPMDDVARVASVMLQRLIMLGTEAPENDMDSSLSLAVQDRLVPGWGQVWVRFEPNVAEVPVPQFIPLPEGTPAPVQKMLVDADIPVDYVPWRSFLAGCARTWEETPWVARIVPMERSNFESRFGKDKATLVTFGEDTTLDLEPKVENKEMVNVYEIWCKTSRKVYWVTKSYDIECLDERQDPLRLPGFFPCPKPLRATWGTSNLLPRSDYTLCSSQYEELDVVNTRINYLVDALKVVGVYDQGSSELKDILTQGRENKMIPVDNWAMFAEKGGIKGCVDWFPVEQVSQVYEQVRQSRADLVAQIYELTGISDIMRGISTPRETARTSELKAQYSSGRLQMYQQETASFVEQVARIKASIAINFLTPDLIIAKTGIAQTEHRQDLIMQAVQLLKNHRLTYWRVVVQADTLGLPDYSNEKQARIEFTTAVGQLLAQSQEFMSASPEMAPFLLEIVQWVAAGFRGGYTIEGVLDEAIETIKKKIANPPPPPPDPKLVQMQAEMQRDQQAAAQEAQNNQQKFMIEMQKMQGEFQQQQREFALELRRLAAEERHANQLHMMEVVEKRLDIIMKKLDIQKARVEASEPDGDD